VDNDAVGNRKEKERDREKTERERERNVVPPTGSKYLNFVSI
jgi:hypothetical protein